MRKTTSRVAADCCCRSVFPWRNQGQMQVPVALTRQVLPAQIRSSARDHRRAPPESNATARSNRGWATAAGRPALSHPRGTAATGVLRSYLSLFGTGYTVHSMAAGKAVELAQGKLSEQLAAARLPIWPRS